MSNSPSEMSFVDFAESIQPSGAVNRFPSIGKGPDVFSYSVYMNGPLTAALPTHALEHTFKDVMLHALTEQLGLNSSSARDNLKVAEMVAIRSTWMSAVLERSSSLPLSQEVLNDYEILSEGLGHPWIESQLDYQRELMSKLQPALLQANLQNDILPKETSIGKVLAQDENFTFQRTSEGEVVTHENRRLDDIPAVGTEVMVSYYRGHGQVVHSLENIKVSPPFIDPISSDLGVMLEDGKGLEQVILFNSLSGFEKFVGLHGLDHDMVRQAIEAREESPKALPEIPARELVKMPYIDIDSGCLAVDYKENSLVYSAIFRDSKEMAALANEFGINQDAVAAGKKLENEVLGNTNTPDVEKWSMQESKADLLVKLSAQGYENFKPSGVDGRTYTGKVVEVSSLHVAQDIGRRVIVIHDARDLDKITSKGESMTVKFSNGRGKVDDMVKSSHSIGR